MPVPGTPESGQGYLGEIEARLKNALNVVGRIGLTMPPSVQLDVPIFDATGPGYRSWIGREFSGSGNITAAIGGQSKIGFQAATACVISRVNVCNEAGAAGTFIISLVAPGGAPDLTYSGAVQYVEGIANDATTIPTTGDLIGTSNDASTPGTQVERFIIGALASMVIPGPWVLPPGGRIIVRDATTNQAAGAVFRGYKL